MLRSLSSCLWVTSDLNQARKVPRKRLTLSLKTMGCYSWGPQPWIPPLLSWHLKLSQRDFCKGVQAKAEQSLDQCHLLWAVLTWGRSWALAREGPWLVPALPPLVLWCPLPHPSSSTFPCPVVSAVRVTSSLFTALQQRSFCPHNISLLSVHPLTDCGPQIKLCFVLKIFFLHVYVCLA